MARGQQLRLLLWKDYLIRKRNLVTLGGVVWAAVVMSSLVIVRNNVRTTDEPTCQYPARALPSAGMLPFLQSFICTINNECKPMDQFQEIPSYKTSRLYSLQQKFSPVWSNDSILELASVLPDAARILTTLARMLDDPQIHEIAKNGIKVADLFMFPGEAGRILKQSLHLDEQTVNTLIQAELNLAGVFTLSPGTSQSLVCDSRTVGAVILLDPVSLDTVSKRACELARPKLEQLAIQLMRQINYRKYLNMLGGITKKLNGEERFSTIGNMLSAVFRLTHLENFIPIEFQIDKFLNLFKKTSGDFGTSEFTYFDITFVSRLLDLFEPIFGDTDIFKVLQSATNSISRSLQWLQQVMQRNNTEIDDSQYELITSALDLLETHVVTPAEIFPMRSLETQAFEDFNNRTVQFFKSVRQVITNSEKRRDENSLELLSDIVNGLLQLIPLPDRHQVLYYGTLLGKLASGARAAVHINTRLEDVMYNVTARHPNAVLILTSLEPNVIRKGFNALMNPERTQVLTSKIYHPHQMFCDVSRLQTFFSVSKKVSEGLKVKLCNDAWNSYIKDVLTEFGIYNVRDRINDMASLIVSEFLGRNNEESLYTISEIICKFKSLAMESVRAISRPKSPRPDWDAVLKLNNDSALYQVVRVKLASTNKILISVHGALAHEVVHQNVVLESRLSAPLRRIGMALSSLVRLLEAQPPTFVHELGLHRRNLLDTLLQTAADEEKMYRIMAADTTELFCNQSSIVEDYLVMPQSVDIANFTRLLCDISLEVDRTLNGSSILAKTLIKLSHEDDNVGDIDWGAIIGAAQDTDALLQDRFGGAGGGLEVSTAELEKVWLEEINLGRILHLSINVLLRVMDVLDKRLFNMTGISPVWLKIKHKVDSSNSLFIVTDNIVNIVTALTSNYSTEELELPITASALKDLYTNLPALVKDVAELLVSDNTDIKPLVTVMRETPAWPCSKQSIGPVLNLSLPSLRAVRGLELVLCSGADVQAEWNRHGHIANIQTIARDFNDTKISPHPFLTLSSRFNLLVADLARLRRSIALSGQTSPASTSGQNMAQTLLDAWDYLHRVIEENNKDYSLYRKVLMTADVLIDAWHTQSVPTFDASLPLARLWEAFTNCSSECTPLRLLASKYSIKFAATAGVQIIADLLEYFTQINEPDVNALQIIGFTKRTGPYILLDKLPDFFLVLLNSYNDQSFMDQVRKASNTAFWDCEALLGALALPAGTRVTQADVARVTPYLCPSLFYWLSVPTDENVLLDLFAKSQLYLFNTPMENLTGKLSTLLDEGLQLNTVLLEVSKKNTSKTFVLTDTILDTFDNIIKENNTLFWNITGNKNYLQFNEMIKKQTASSLYQTEITYYLYNFVELINDLNGTNMTSVDFKANQNVKSFLKMSKRRPTELLEIFYNAITRKVMNQNEEFDIVNALDLICSAHQSNKSEEQLLFLNEKMVKQFCVIDYSWLYRMVFENNSEYLPEKAFRNLVSAFGYNESHSRDLNAFWINSTQVRELTAQSLLYANDLGLSGYLQQLHSTLRHQQISLHVLAGRAWWPDLRALYTGPHATSFFDMLEGSFQIVEDVLQHLDKIKLVRLLFDVNVNDTSVFCDKVSVSAYIPDATGRLHQLQQLLCHAARNRELLFTEIPPLNFAAQGFSRKLSTQVNEAELNQTIEEVQSEMEYLLQHSPSAPRLPNWVTVPRLATLQTTLQGLTSRQALTSVAFGATYNFVDAVTLFGNSSTVCPACSTLTKWLKQINLQLIKWQDYTALVCRLDALDVEQIYAVLKENFHWDMALEEIMSRRNYTKIELNKSLNQFIDNVRLNFGHSALCLHNYTADNNFMRAAFYVSLGNKIVHLVRAAVPHLRSIPGAAQNIFLSDLRRSIEQKIPVLVPVLDVVNNGSALWDGMEFIENVSLNNLTNMKIDINKITIKTLYQTSHVYQQYILLQNASNNWTTFCDNVNCTKLINIIKDKLNSTWIDRNIERLRVDAFWQFHWFSAVLDGSRRFLSAAEHLLMVASQLDMPTGDLQLDLPAVNLSMTEQRQPAFSKFEGWLDVVLKLVQKNTIAEVVASLSGMVNELHPLLVNSELDEDLKSLSAGLSAIRKLMDEVVENFNLKWNIGDIFKDFHNIEIEFKNIGINQTEFWSVAAEKIQGGAIDVSPLFLSDGGNKFISIREYVCDVKKMSLIIFPASSEWKEDGDDKFEQVLRATSDQFCGLKEEEVRQLLPILMRNVNTTYILQEVGDAILYRVYASSGLSMARGSAALVSAARGVPLLSSARTMLDDVTAELKKEPLFAAFRGANTVGDLLSSPSFLSDAGRMLCGTPLATDNNRFYKAIAKTKDKVSEPDHEQLQSLPSDFCRTLYVDILNMSGGKIIWSFAKPLLMGRILFTPDNSETRKIMAHANTSFASISSMRSLVSGLSDALHSAHDAALHWQGVDTLQRLASSQILHNWLGNNNNEDHHIQTDIDLSQLFDSLPDAKVSELISKLSSLLECVNLNRFMGVGSEAELERKAAEYTLLNEFSAGIVFLNMSNDAGSASKSQVHYKVRMDIDTVPTTSRRTNQFWTPGPEGNFLEDMRYFRGFVQIQDLVDKAIISVSSVRADRHSRAADLMSDSQQHSKHLSNEWAVYTQQMPYPCYKRDAFQATLYESQALIVAFFFCLILTVSSAVRFIVSEDESGNTALMVVMGLKLRNRTASWLIASSCEMLVTVTIVFLVLKLGPLPVLPHSDPFLLWLLMFNFGFSVVMFCYLVSKLFQSGSLGAVCAVLLYFISFLPYVIILSMEAVLSTSQKVFTGISMSTAFCYSVYYVARLEVQGEGLQWSTLWHAPGSADDINVAITALIVFADAMLYAVLGYLIQLFIEYRLGNGKFIKDTMRLNQEKDTDADVGVSVCNVSKVYRGGRLALDNVSVELMRGQITALLGHNGAGKTTLIKILTGMLRPTSGKVVIGGQREWDCCEGSLAGASAGLGVCPQSDVLVECMSASEHLSFYAQLKTGLSADAVSDHVNEMLAALSLGALSQEPAHRLSGGLRRRLCVSLAFVARPDLVVLDEPSSGVDPLARRDIWSLIVKLKEGRTVLLSTHHLDEAELLSDRVIILDKGRVFTSGSPLTLKHRFGDGYTLTVTYKPIHNEDLQNTFISNEDRHNHWSTEDEVITWSGDSELMNANNPEWHARITDLLESVQSVVSNARLRSYNGKVAEVVIPFHDSAENNNDLLLLSTLLEKRRGRLRYQHYALDCCSLEQVFSQTLDQNTDSDDRINGDHASQIETCRVEDVSSSSSSTGPEVTQMPSHAAWDGKLRGTRAAQLHALLDKRARHYVANYWLLIILFALPTLFVAIAMGFSLIRPPQNDEAALLLSPALYNDGTVDFVNLDLTHWKNNNKQDFGDAVLKNIVDDSSTRRMKSVISWNQEKVECECIAGRQHCKADNETKIVDSTLLIPRTSEILNWIVTTEGLYTEKRYGGWSTAEVPRPASSGRNPTGLVVWYNNKGHHAMPAYLNALNSAVLRTFSGNTRADIHTYSHPLKISQEQLTKSTLLQHVADVGISCFILIGFSLIPAGGAVYLVGERRSEQKQLQLMCGVSPTLYWVATLMWDLFVMAVNIALTSLVLMFFSFPVFVEKDNLPAICLLLFLFGFACSSLVHLLEKLFWESSVATMLLFCGNVFVGVAGMAVLLIIDILSDSDFTDYIRWVLHKVFLLSPQFALGDGLVEIAKNTIQAQVLQRFNMDTYKSPLEYELIGHHYVALVLVGLLLFTLNILLENNWFDWWFISDKVQEPNDDTEDMDVATERYRVELNAMKSAARPTAIHTLGNINAGFVSHHNDEEGEVRGEEEEDVLQVLSLRKEYVSVTGNRVAVDNVTFGLKPGQCMGLLGVNGAGKSTTFGMLCGHLLPSAGQVKLCGRLAGRAELRQGYISYCPQSDALDPLLTTRQQLKFYCELRGIDNMDEVMDKTMEEFDLSKYKSQRTRTLSGGNKRKLCAAIALMSRAPLVLLDEPTSGMDPSAARAVVSAVRRACLGTGAAAGQRRAALLSTHALAECGAACARVAVLAAGRVAALGTTQHLNRRFGGGYLLCVRISVRERLPALVAAVRGEFPLSRTLCSQYCTAQFLVPVATPGDKSEVSTKLSDILSALARLTTQHAIQDFTLNQSSLDQMFVNFTYSLGCHEQHSFPESETSPEEFSCAVLERFSSTKLDEEDGTVVTSL